VSRSAVSQHLRVLKDAELAVVRIEGTRRLYAIDMRGLESLRGWLDGFWDKALSASKQAASL
jgi:DNA-binding transcriptional ArsR family regulator